MAIRRDIFKQLEGITNRRAVGYARYSSEMQRDGWTIQAQVGTLTDHFKAKGIPLVDITKDEARSGKTIERAGIQEALDYIRRGEANVFAVCKLDRATRNAFDAFGLERELRSLGASLYCIEENIDTSDPNARMMFGIHAVMAQRYRENLAFETAKGKKARALDGLANGDPPYGYRRATAADLPGFTGDADALRKALRRMPYIQVPERAEAVRMAYELYATGTHSDATVARELNARGYRMISKRHPDGYPFTKDTVTTMLQDPLYYGLVGYDGIRTHGHLDLKLRRRHGRTIYAEDGGKPKLGQHEPIITKDLFDRVQAIRASRHRTTGGHAPREGVVYLGAKLPRCAACGERLRANPARAGAIYRDASRERGLTCEATRRSIPAPLVDEAVAAFIAAIRLPDNWKAVALQAATSGADVQRRAERRSGLERQLERLHELKYDPDTDLADWRARKAKVEAELAAMEHESPTVDVERAAALLGDLKALWDDATPEERQAMVAGVIENVWCDLDGKRVLTIQPKDWLHVLRDAFPDMLSYCGTDRILYPANILPIHPQQWCYKAA